MSIAIRPLTKDDIPAMREITWAAWMGTYARFIPEADLRTHFSIHYSAETLGDVFESPDFAGFLALVSGRPAGYVKTNFEQRESRLYITSVYVLPEFQRGGLGRRLMHEALRHARELALPEVWIGVMVENAEALAWYERLGFRFVREEPFTMGSTTVAHRIGCKQLI